MLHTTKYKKFSIFEMKSNKNRLFIATHRFTYNINTFRIIVNELRTFSNFVLNHFTKVRINRGSIQRKLGLILFDDGEKLHRPQPKRVQTEGWESLFVTMKF